MLTIILIVLVPYLAIGFALCLIIDIEDVRARRISIPGALSSLAGLNSVLFVVFVLLWPAWYFPYRAAVKKGKPPVIVAYGKDQAAYMKPEKPIQPPQPTRPSGPRS